LWIGQEALTNRTLNFGSQPFYPPGIDGSAPGPFFNLFQTDFTNAGTQGGGRGVVWFAGSVPLYRNGVLVGGLGVSGDGVEQDDYVAALGNRKFAKIGRGRRGNCKNGWGEIAKIGGDFCNYVNNITRILQGF
jgi:hypothetical protein